MIAVVPENLPDAEGESERLIFRGRTAAIEVENLQAGSSNCKKPCLMETFSSSLLWPLSGNRPVAG